MWYGSLSVVFEEAIEKVDEQQVVDAGDYQVGGEEPQDEEE